MYHSEQLINQVVPEPDQLKINTAIAGIDAWLDTMRGPHGYCGPVSHWWQDCLQYPGIGLDWRYQGIILGYLNLLERTGNLAWLTKARQAGNDLAAGQLPGGNYRNSSFEANPKTGGNPHEAACDLALIRLAQCMRVHGISGWEDYIQSAYRNIQTFILGQLWEPDEKYFQNLVDDPIFVPNKAATIIQALFAWMDFSGENDWLEQYILPTLECIISCQVQILNSRLDGAIDQAKGINKREGWFFPFYNARCIPALILGYQKTEQERYLDVAKNCMEFILRVRYEDGSFPQVLRANGRTYRYPQWLAGVGDILLAMNLLEQYDAKPSKNLTELWMMQHILPNGSVSTASGFAHWHRWQRKKSLPDFRDILPVVGWVDKAFHYLTTQVNGSMPAVKPTSQSVELPCLYHGRKCIYREDDQFIEARDGRHIYYRWQKGVEWAEVS
jgi:hypothetical protein